MYKIVIVLVLAVVAGILVWPENAATDVHQLNPVARTPGKKAQTKKADPSHPEVSLAPLAEAPQTSAPFHEVANEPVSVWTSDGELTPEIISRYQLSAAQINSLRGLRIELVERMQAIEKETATTETSPDGNSITVSIKADGPIAKEFSDYFQGEVRNVLGADAYADFSKSFNPTVADELSNAGLMDKKISIQKLPIDSSWTGVRYHMKIERTLIAPPVGTLRPPPDSYSTELTGSRVEIAKQLSTPSLIPAGF